MLLQSLHGTAGKHPGISKIMQEIRQKYYFPSIATYVKNWVRYREICIQDKRINSTRITPELILIKKLYAADLVVVCANCRASCCLKSFCVNPDQTVAAVQVSIPNHVFPPVPQFFTLPRTQLLSSKLLTRTLAESNYLSYVTLSLQN